MPTKIGSFGFMIIILRVTIETVSPSIKHSMYLCLRLQLRNNFMHLSDHTGMCKKYFEDESYCPYYPVDSTNRKLHSPMCCDADGCKCLCLEICPNIRRAHAAMSVLIPTDEFDECAELNPNINSYPKMKEWKDNKCIETQTRNRSSVMESLKMKFWHFTQYTLCENCHTANAIMWKL